VGKALKTVIILVASIISIILVGNFAFYQIQNQQHMQGVVAQDMQQLDAATTNLIATCSTVISIDDLNGCKAHLSDIISKCKDPSYSSMTSCSDPRIAQFFTTVDSKISHARSVLIQAAQAFNTQILHSLSTCSQATGDADKSECKTMMLQIQQDCTNITTQDTQYIGANSVPACQDPRVNEILTGSIYSQSSSPITSGLNPTSQDANTMIQSANQYTLSYIDSCMKFTDPTALQVCSQTAKKMLDYCNNVSTAGIGQICNDPRLQQLANMNQTVAPTTDSQTPVNATALNNLNSGMQKILNECTGSTISNSNLCINAINTVKQTCNGIVVKTYPSYFPICEDPRLQ
jgi:hypothetical protein